MTDHIDTTTPTDVLDSDHTQVVDARGHYDGRLLGRISQYASTNSRIWEALGSPTTVERLDGIRDLLAEQGYHGLIDSDGLPVSTEGNTVAEPYRKTGEIVRALRDICDVLATLPGPRAEASLGTWSITVQPGQGRTEDVDRLGMAFLGEPGETHQLGEGVWHRSVGGYVGPIELRVFCGDAEPLWARRERLAAEIDAIDAQIGDDGGSSR